MKRRTFLATAALLPPVISATGQVAWAEPRGGTTAAEPELLGVPITDVNLIGAQVLTGPDGVPLLCGVTTGAPAKVSTVDARTGELRSTEPLPGAGGAYATAVGEDGHVYVGSYSNSHLYRVDPATGAVTDLGAPLPGETFLFGLTAGPDSRLYGATYPGTKVFSFDVRTGAVHDYGRIATDTKYARAVAVFGGALYVGTERGVHVVRLDPTTGERRELPLPAGIRQGDLALSVWDVNVAGGHVYVRIGTDIKHSTLHVLDPVTETWVAQLDNVAGLQLPPPGPDGAVYVMHANELTAWDPATGRLTGTGLVYPGRVWNYRGAGWVELADPQWPGPTLTGWFWRGEMWRYNPATGRHSVSAATVPGEPAEMLSLATGRDGAVLAGGYLAGFARVDPAEATIEFHRFSQTETLIDDGESVWIGAYPDARGYRYDPDRPWHSPEYSPGPPGAAENPVKVWDLHDTEDPQDRVFAIARTGDLAVAATGPRSPTFGGAVVVHDLRTGRNSVRDVGLGDLTTCDLTVLDGVVYGGTWIHGGSGAPTPPLTEGDVYAYDPVADRVLWRSRPVPGAAAYAAITADRDGRLWTIGDSTLAEVDPADGTTLRVLPLGDAPAGGRTFPNTVAILRTAPDAPLLYAKSGGRLWRIWTTSGAVEDLGLSGYRLFTVLPDGTLALARGAELFHWRSPAHDRTRPDVSIGLTRAPGGRLPSVTVTVTDAGGSGVRQVRCLIDHGPWTDYTGPVPLSRPGRHLVRAVAVDGAGNRTEVCRSVLARPRS